MFTGFLRIVCQVREGHIRNCVAVMGEKVSTSFGFGRYYWLESHYSCFTFHFRSRFSKVNEKGRDRAEVRMDQVKVSSPIKPNKVPSHCYSHFQLRSFKSELDIEEIVKHRTEQIFQVWEGV